MDKIQSFLQKLLNKTMGAKSLARIPHSLQVFPLHLEFMTAVTLFLLQLSFEKYLLTILKDISLQLSEILFSQCCTSRKMWPKREGLFCFPLYDCAALG